MVDTGESKEPVALEGRNARRKERTRSALVTAAQEILAEGAANSVSIQAITERADVGFGSFYNHFPGKPELFAAAREDAFGQYRAWIEKTLTDAEDPIRRLGMTVRLTGRLAQAHPLLARVLTNHFVALDASPPLIAFRIREDVTAVLAAVPGGNQDADVTVLAASGAIAEVIRALTGRTPEDQARMADAVARNVLRMVGVDNQQIQEIMSIVMPAPSFAQPGPIGTVVTRHGGL